MTSTLAEPARRVEAAIKVPTESNLTLELLSSIAHEFRAPLSALAASAEMLPLAEGEEQARFSEIIQRQTHRLSSIVDGLIEAYSAPRRQQHDLDTIDVAMLLGELTSELHTVYPSHHFDVETSSTHVITERRALAMILSNLLSNAARYSPAGATVRIRCDETDDGVRFRVFDEGPGVPEILRRRIFRAGERGNFDGAAGCGLGLFIAQRLADAIGARIGIDDSYDGPGACFALVLGE